MRKKISTHTQTEIRVGYSRAVIVNNTMYISGTTSIDQKGNVIGKTVYEQANHIFDILENVLYQANFSLEDVVLVRAYLVTMVQLQGFDQAFREKFSAIKPACTMVGISKLVSPELLIEIECIAQKE